MAIINSNNPRAKKKAAERRLFVVPSQSDPEAVQCLEELLVDARRGELVGIAFAAIYRGGEFIVDFAGEARRRPTYSRGAVAALDDCLKKLMWNTAG